MSSTNTGAIFNVEEATGKERAMLETTAAQARLEAPNLATAEKIDANAEKEHQAAVEAARVAQKLTGASASQQSGPTPMGASVPSATDNFINAGSQHSEIETTAAQAVHDAPDFSAAYQAENNARKEQEAAKQAAATAKTLGTKLTGEPSTAAGAYHSPTDAAVAEGKRDVEQAKAVTAGYVEQAKQMVNSTVEAAQTFVSSNFQNPSEGELPKTTAATGTGKTVTETGADTFASLQAMAENALKAAQPVVQGAYTTVVNTAQPVVSSATQATKEYIASAKTTGLESAPTDTLKPASEHNIPSKTAPLQTGAATVESPYDRAATKPTAQN